VRTILRLTLVVAGLVAVLGASAQEEVTLQHRFDLGQQMQYRITGNFGGGMQVEGQQPMGMPVGDMQMNFETGITAEVDAIGRDFAELAIRLQSISADMNMAGQAINFELNEDGGGVYVGGQQVADMAQMTAGAPGGVNIVQEIFHFPFLVRLDQSGKLKGIPQIDLMKLFLPQLKLDEMMEVSTGYLPTHPVKVGDTWTQILAMPVPLPDLQGNPQSEVSFDYRLAGLQQEGQNTLATINMKGHVEVGEIADLMKLLGPLGGESPFMGTFGPFGAAGMAGPAAQEEPAPAAGEGPAPVEPQPVVVEEPPTTEPGAEAAPAQVTPGIRNMVMDLDGEMTFDVTRGLLTGLTANIVINAEMTQPIPAPPQPAAEGAPDQPPANAPTMTTMTIKLKDFKETIQMDLVDVKQPQ